MRRVVVTGMGLVSPLGVGLDHNWSRLTNGESGAVGIQGFDVSDLPAKIAAPVPRGDGSNGTFNPDNYVSAKDQRRIDDFIVYGVSAATEAVEDSGWKPDDVEDQERTGVMIGSGIGGLQTIYEGSKLLNEQGPRKVGPFFIPSALINLASGHVSIKYGFKGPNHAVVTACSTGAHAIGDAARLIMWDDADVMVAGGAEAAICRIGIAGFAACRALSTGYNDTPEAASRPYDKGRDGFVMGEGAGVVVLEEYEHAKKRGAKIYAELVGGGLSADAYHMTAPHPEGIGAIKVMENCLRDANVSLEAIDTINMHGTSTPLGDVAESKALHKVFGEHLYSMNINSTKSMTGHLLGAAGAVEAISSILSINNSLIPPTINHQTKDEAIDEKINFTFNKAQQREVTYAMSNTFGFGGHNACVLFKKFED